jgi:hypothetical protein
MNLTDTKHYFLLVMIAAAGLAASIVFGSADADGASQATVITPSAKSLVYFPAQYTLNASNQVNEHIQAF